MDVLFDINFVRLRLRQIEESYPEPTALGDCDCTSYTYFLFSIILLTLGTLITVPALGGVDHHVFSYLGHMWIVGPICICSGLMVAIKSLLYLRRKSMIQMLLRQRALIRGLQELTRGQELRASGGGGGGGGSGGGASTLALPPPYDLIVQATGPPVPPPLPTTELPPPSYAEAMLLITADKTQQPPSSTREES